MTDQIGRVLDSRYVLSAPIGTGTSAQVFLADDVRLHRRVAVKVLHPALAEDPTFLRRFRAEAQATAKLIHANIVKLFDSGDDPGPYLVTEFVDGGSLRALLDQGRRLTVAQAVDVGRAAASGLDFAHRRGFVHRDIKPANLLFGRDGRLRIADFGVARALAEAAWTEPSEAVLGTARYASPEQANGQPATGRSDVYSLALVLVEAVTGHVPFATDTTIATLRARVGARLELDPQFGPLGPVLEWAGRPDPDDRPDAAQLGAALAEVAEQLDPPGALPLAGALATDHLAPFVDPDPTHLPAEGESPLLVSDEPATDAAPEVPEAREATGEAEATGVAEATEAPDEADPGAVVPPAATAGEPGPTRRRRPTPVLVVAGLLVVAVAVVGLGAVRELLRPRHEVPELAGLDASELTALVAGMGWDVERVPARQDGTREGEILAQDPAAGSQLREGHTLQVTVSQGPELVAVPTNLAGLDQSEAAAALEAVRLAPGAITEKWGELVPAGIVLGESLLFDEVPAGTSVPLVVSKGPRPRAVPEGVAGAGLSYDEVAARLQEVQLVATRGQDYSDTVPEGQVIDTSPAAGTLVPRDSEVVVLVSLGPQPVIVPDVSGDTVARAQAALEDAGLVVDGVEGPPDGVVTGTDPDAGSEVDRGSSIVLLTERGAGGSGGTG